MEPLPGLLLSVLVGVQPMPKPNTTSYYRPTAKGLKAVTGPEESHVPSDVDRTGAV